VLGLDQLGLTPIQMGEVRSADPALVAAWLAAASLPEIKSPAGFFLVGLRSGLSPAVVADATRARKIRTASAWIRNVGAIVSEDEMAEELFDGRGAQLARWRDDDGLREAMRVLWRQVQ
jgi:hypothetical protein